MAFKIHSRVRANDFTLSREGTEGRIVRTPETTPSGAYHMRSDGGELLAFFEHELEQVEDLG